MGCFKCNGLAVSLKNTLFSDVFQYDNEKLVNAVLKTKFIYLLFSVKRFKAWQVTVFKICSINITGDYISN